MKLNTNFLAVLNASAGAGSVVTNDEYNKQQITLVKEEKEVLFAVLSASKIFRGNVSSGGKKAEQSFILYKGAQEIRPISPHLVFPKPKKDELRLYISDKAFAPEKGSFWYLFVRNDKSLCLGWCHLDELELLKKGLLNPNLDLPDNAGLEEENDEGDEILERIERSILARRGQAKFRKAVRKLFNDTCAMSGSKTLAVLEAAHIAITAGKDNNGAKNGLLLRADIHTLFDLSLILIDPDSLRVAVHPSLRGSEYWKYDGQELTVGPTVRKKLNVDGFRARWKMRSW